jgi:hypothetical protein
LEEGAEGGEVSIERQFGRIIFCCDWCTNQLETDEEDWNEALQVKRSEGWGSRKDGDQWIDVCEQCKANPYD